MRLPPRWVVAVSIAVAAAILGDSLLYAVLPTIYDDLGLQAAMVGILLSANRFVRLISNPIAGWVVARTGVRVPFLIAVFVAALTTASYATGLGFAVFLIGRLLWGVCWSFLRIGGYLAALESSNDDNRGYYLGFFNGVTRFGSFVAALIGGFMTDLIGFETTVYAFAGITLIGGLAVLRERPPAITSQPASAIRHATSARVSQIARDLSSGDLRLRLAVIFAAVLIQAMAVQGLITATLGSWLEEQYTEDVNLILLTAGVATVNGVLLSTKFLSEFLWGPFSGHLSDRHGRRRFLLIAGLVEVSAMIGLALAANIWLTIFVAITLFLAVATVKVTLDALAGDHALPERRSQTMSWYATASDLGSAAGPIIGWIVGIGLGLQWLYLGSAATLLLIGLTFLTIFSRTSPAPVSTQLVGDEVDD